MTFEVYFLPQSTALGPWNHQKKVPSSTPSRRPFLGVTTISEIAKNGKNLTFDRKAVETQFFYQHDRNLILKRFPYVWGHFSLKCFLNGLIGQLLIFHSFLQNGPFINNSHVMSVSEGSKNKHI